MTLLKKFPEFSEKESKLNFDILDNLFSCEDLYVSVLKTSNEVISNLEFLNEEIKKNLYNEQKKLKETEEFIQFFKHEIPDVYKKLWREFENLKKYDE